MAAIILKWSLVLIFYCFLLNIASQSLDLNQNAKMETEWKITQCKKIEQIIDLSDYKDFFYCWQLINVSIYSINIGLL